MAAFIHHRTISVRWRWICTVCSSCMPVRCTTRKCTGATTLRHLHTTSWNGNIGLHTVYAIISMPKTPTRHGISVQQAKKVPARPGFEPRLAKVLSPSGQQAMWPIQWSSPMNNQDRPYHLEQTSVLLKICYNF